MADRVDKATRSRIMAAIKSRDTKPELALARALRRAGVKQWSRSRKYRLPGTPDFVFYFAHLAVFMHGCFWHCCRQHYKAPSAKGFRRKMDANRRRDIRVRRQLRKLGWRTLVVWEHEDCDKAAQRIMRRLQVQAVRDRLEPPILGIRRSATFTVKVNFAEPQQL